MPDRTDLFRRMRNSLADCYPQPSRAGLFVSDAGLSLAAIDFSGPATVFWQDILSEADRAGKVGALLDLAIAQAPARADLAALREEHRNWVTSEPESGTTEEIVSLGAEAIRSPRKWVLVTGTGTKDSLRRKVSETAERLGRLLAEHGYGLVTGGWRGVDEVVARAYNKEVYRSNRVLEDFLIQVVEDGQLPAFPAGDLRIVRARAADRLLDRFDLAQRFGPWTAEALALADVILVIEGLGGAGQIARAALESRKLVFPLADTDGDAKAVYWEAYTSWDKDPERMPGVSKRQFAIAAREAPEVVDQIVALLDSLFPIGASQ